MFVELVVYFVRAWCCVAGPVEGVIELGKGEWEVVWVSVCLLWDVKGDRGCAL